MSYRYVTLYRLGRWPHLPRLPLHRPQKKLLFQKKARWHTSLAVPIIPRTWPRRICGLQFLAGLPQFSDLPSLQIDFEYLLSFINFIPVVGLLLPGHQRDHIILISPFTSTSSHRCSGVVSPSANQHLFEICTQYVKFKYKYFLFM